MLERFQTVVGTGCRTQLKQANFARPLTFEHRDPVTTSARDSRYFRAVGETLGDQFRTAQDPIPQAQKFELQAFVAAEVLQHFEGTCRELVAMFSLCPQVRQIRGPASYNQRSPRNVPLGQET